MRITLPFKENAAEDEHEACLDATDLFDQGKDRLVLALNMIDVGVKVDIVASKLHI